MSVLLYCVVEENRTLQIPPQGVLEMSVRTVSASTLHCLVSEADALSELRGDEFRDAALTFHQVIHPVLMQTAVIPFRFPTLMATELEVLELLTSRNREYRDALAGVRDRVQMEIRLIAENSADPPEQKQSGTEYLRKRSAHKQVLELAASRLIEGVAGIANRWAQRYTTDGLRCYALIRRTSIEQFQERVRAVPIPGQLRAVASGPWPATEFMQLEST